MASTSFQRSSPECIRILGLDPGLVRTGWGLVDVVGSRLIHVAHGVLKPPPSNPMADRLLFLHDGIVEVLNTYKPDEVAVEETFSNVNPESTIKLGHARGVIMVPPAKAGLPVAEYAAKEVKKALVGTGGADKTQVAFMIRTLLPGSDLRSGDAADALAVAITHAHRRRELAGMR